MPIAGWFGVGDDLHRREAEELGYQLASGRQKRYGRTSWIARKTQKRVSD
jgi:hypothetical protein